MFSSIISGIIDGIISAAVKWLQGIQQRREDVATGRAEQHTADVEATISEAKENAEIHEHVEAMDDKSVDDALERLRLDAAKGSPASGS